MASKYRAQKTRYNGMTFDSKGELARWLVLVDEQYKYKVIKGLERQVKFPIRNENGKPLFYYVADYVYVDLKYPEGPVIVIEDFKGFQTDVFKLKWKLMMDQYGNKNFGGRVCLCLSGTKQNSRRRFGPRRRSWRYSGGMTSGST